MLKRTAFFSSVWTFLGNGAQQALALGTFIYLARLLTPHDFGAMALAAAVIDLLTIFGRFGQVEALLQQGPSDDSGLSTSFWLLCAIGLGLLVFIAAIAWPFGAMYQVPVVTTILLLLAPVPFIQNLGQVHEALLRREFRYKGVAFRNFGATFAGVAASIALATAGYGVYALAFQKLAFTIAYTGLVLIARPWRPAFEFRRAIARRLLSTGLDVTISNTLMIANGRIIDFIVGYFLGVVVLGWTRLAFRLYDFLSQLIIVPITTVSISAMSHIRENKTQLRNVYLRYLQLLYLLASPLYVGISIIAFDVIVLATGPKWAPSAQILSWLSLAGLISSISYLFSPTMIIARHSGTVRRQAIFQTLTTAATVWASAQFHSIVPVLAVHLVRVYVFAAINGAIMNRTLEVSSRQFWLKILPAVLSVGVMAAVCLPLHHALGGQSLLIRIAAILIAAPCLYAGTLFAGDRFGVWRGLIDDIGSVVRAIVAKPRAAPPDIPA